jgi:hypothetical protein
MKKVSQEIDDLLLDYLAGKLQGEKLEKVKKGLSTSESLRERLEAFKLIEHSLQESRLMNPNENFTQRVMNNLHRVPSTSILTPKNGLMLLLGILVAAGIGVVLVDAGLYNSLNGILALNQIEAPMGLKTPSLPSIPLNGKWLVNSIIALNIGLAFLILDRTILKPLFNKRSRIQF